MTAKRAVVMFMLTPLAAYVALLCLYIAAPSLFHFRGWELVDVFVYNGHRGAGTYTFHQTGDEARGYLLQRYGETNTVTLNRLGNRVACYDPSPSRQRILVLGDSQAFGMGSSDAATFPAQLCSQYGASVYNGAKRHGLSLLRVKELTFDALLFTSTERFPLAETYCSGQYGAMSDHDKRLAEDALALPSRISPGRILLMVRRANEFLYGLMLARLETLMKAVIVGPKAPEGHIISVRHRHHPLEAVIEKDVTCARELDAFYSARGYRTGFLFFPAQQTLYGAEAGVPVDPETLSFIDKITARLRAAGLRTLDTKACLDRAKQHELVNHRHDTHLNDAGYRAIAECLRGSDLEPLLTTAR